MRLAAKAEAPALERLGVEAPEFLLVHGALGQAAMWREVIAACPGRCLALSLRGHGASGGRERLQDWTLDDYLDDVLRVLRTLPRPPVLVGHSMGALLGLLAAERAPLAGLVLLAPPPRDGWRREALRVFWHRPRATWDAMRTGSLLAPMLNPETCRALLLTPDAPEELVARAQAVAQEESWRASFAMRKAHYGRPPCPVRLLAGAEDGLVSAAATRRLGEFLGVEPVFLPGRGHLLPMQGDATELLRAAGISP
ncbi:alpha/beta fold hydrolase [Sabulicella rubraurantiaca]|uniref:alpha/beta fold hydrolase n=1 Tax=Sabulicella rubraurantiaca TaxID=2811429 RepID=UPI001A967786|nr:alpha/beta fold hydrolase [Sabulicella rubraurantiaca]